MVLLENVCGLKDRINGSESQLADVLRTLESMGYVAGWTECNTMDYHLPQRRPRLWIWAFSRCGPPVLPAAGSAAMRALTQPALVSNKIEATIKAIQHSTVVHYSTVQYSTVE
jgi:site-specific DNA-cytosine methylase